MSKATLVPQPNYSQYSSPVEALNLIVESKSLPVELNNSTIELHLPVEAKEKLPIFQSGSRMSFDGAYSLTHSILINLFIKPGLNNFLPPPLLSIIFVQGCSIVFQVIW